MQDPGEMLVPAVCLAEVFRTLAREVGEPAALIAAGVMRQARVVALDADLAIGAARVGRAASHCRWPTASSRRRPRGTTAPSSGPTTPTSASLPGVRFIAAPPPSG